MTTTSTTAADRVRKYVEQRTGMRPLDPDEVHAVHVGHEREARLTLTDLRTLLAMADAVQIALNAPGPGPIRDHELWRHHEDCRPLEGCECGLSDFRRALLALVEAK